MVGLFIKKNLVKGKIKSNPQTFWKDIDSRNFLFLKLQLIAMSREVNEALYSK